MALLQPKLNLKVSQRQVLTPGLMQMVSVLALNKLELKEMINTEMVENPVLEEVDESAPPLEELAGIEGTREQGLDQAREEKNDPFDEIDFGSYFQEYLDPGFRTQGNNFEELDSPSFENFLSQPSTLTDHLFWQLGSLALSPEVREAAEYILGNLDEHGYLPVQLEELTQGFLAERATLRRPKPVSHGVEPIRTSLANAGTGGLQAVPRENAAALASQSDEAAEAGKASSTELAGENWPIYIETALKVVQGLDPVGVASRDLRECLMLQILAQVAEFEAMYKRRMLRVVSVEPSSDVDRMAAAEAQQLDARREIFQCAQVIVDQHLAMLQKRDLRELAKAVSRPVELVQQAFDFIRTLDPRPGQRYNRSEARLIEPDVAFVKRGDEWAVVMNEEDLPTLRLNQGYRRLLSRDRADKDVRDYVKDRYRSAIQLLRNIEQRKNTILRTCEVIVRRQAEFLELGVEALKPMMIKEVAEEIGVHPSTISRAVSSKYVHTPQGVYELRFFFTEGVNGPEGAGTPLMLLKRRVKKLIEEEDPRRPLTDDHIAAALQTSGINVTRRTVAKYREDMNIPSTHQRRKRD